MRNRSKMVPENILKTGAVQVQQIKHRNMIHICNSTLLHCYIAMAWVWQSVSQSVIILVIKP